MISSFQALYHLPPSKERDTILKLHKQVIDLQKLLKKHSLVAAIFRAACRLQCPMCFGRNHRHTETCTLWPLVQQLTWEK